MIASQLMKEAIYEANHLGRGSAKAPFLGESSSSMAGERTIPGGLLSKTRPQSQELCVLEEESGAGKVSGLPGGGAEMSTEADRASFQTASPHVWESIWHRDRAGF